MSMRHVSHQAVATPRTAEPPRHLRVGSGFIEKHQPAIIERGPPEAPTRAAINDIGPLLLRCMLWRGVSWPVSARSCRKSRTHFVEIRYFSAIPCAVTFLNHVKLKSLHIGRTRVTSRHDYDWIPPTASAPHRKSGAILAL